MRSLLPLALSSTLAIAALSSCATRKEPEPEPAVAETPQPKPEASGPRPTRPSRPAPPPQPQDGSMIVAPGGTRSVASRVSEVSEEDRSEIIDAAEKELNRRKENAAEGGDLVSEALQNIEQDDLDKAFSELKQAVENYDGGE